jgi:hypothetical protein
MSNLTHYFTATNKIDTDYSFENLEKVIIELQSIEYSESQLKLVTKQLLDEVAYRFKPQKYKSAYKIFALLVAYPKYIDDNDGLRVAIKNKIVEFFNNGDSNQLGKPYIWLLERLTENHQYFEEEIRLYFFDRINSKIEQLMAQPNFQPMLLDPILEFYPAIFHSYLNDLINNLAKEIYWTKLDFILQTTRGKEYILQLNCEESCHLNEDRDPVFCASKRLLLLKNNLVIQKRTVRRAKTMSRDTGLPYKTCMVKLISV